MFCVTVDTHGEFDRTDCNLLLGWLKGYKYEITIIVVTRALAGFSHDHVVNSQ